MEGKRIIIITILLSSFLWLSNIQKHIIFLTLYTAPGPKELEKLHDYL